MQVVIEILKSWATPSAVLIFIGAITWGVQLNFGLVLAQREIAELKTKATEIERTINTDHMVMRADIQRLTLIQNNTLAKVAEGLKHIDDHNKEAEQWIRKILQNTGRIEGLEKAVQRFGQ